MSYNLLSRGITEDYFGVTWSDTIPNIPPEAMEEVQDVLHKVGLTQSTYMAKMKAIYNISHAWIKDVIINKTQNLNMILLGSGGSGKTYLGSLILKTILDNKHRSVLRIQARSFVDNYLSTYVTPEAYKSDIVLFIDDLGKEGTTKDQKGESYLDGILTYRKERRFPTILSSALPYTVLTNRYGTVMQSLLSGSYFSLTFPDIDLRSCITRATTSRWLKNINKN